ncbi:hypothetical protein I3843_07G095500 [Carya illinoinensis]|nr:hypothetical protein I3843_07G095500 [Carya illinoinensis]
MYVTASGATVNEMSYAMSKLDIEIDLRDEGKTIHEVSHSQRSNKRLKYVDNEISQLARLHSRPHELLSQVTPGKRELPIARVKMLAGRECNYSGRGRFSSANCCHVLSRYLPVNGPWLVNQMNSRAYVSQFIADGSLFIAGFQGSHIRIYYVDRGWTVQKNILAKSLRWTVTDTLLSPYQCHLVYASMSPTIHIVNARSTETESLANITHTHDGLGFSQKRKKMSIITICNKHWSPFNLICKILNSDDSIYVYDLEANKLSLRILAHTSDVNTVCFAEESGHLIYSGSDDTFCKVWDRRCFVARDKPAGVLMGHLEGITFIDSRGDGRYLISNGKDQSIKLWDIRGMSSNARCNPGFKSYEWDYRWMDYPPQAKEVKHPCDQSVATFRGHSVLQTLIRCYCSPVYR